MQDNQLVQDLVESILASVNASRLPLAVKALALENILLRVQAGHAGGGPGHTAADCGVRRNHADHSAHGYTAAASVPLCWSGHPGQFRHRTAPGGARGGVGGPGPHGHLCDPGGQHPHGGERGRHGGGARRRHRRGPHPRNTGRIVFAGTGAGVQRITADLPYLVTDHAAVEGDTPAPEPSAWEQYVTRMQQALDAVVPPTGNPGQVLTKTSEGNVWTYPSGGGGQRRGRLHHRRRPQAGPRKQRPLGGHCRRGGSRQHPPRHLGGGVHHGGQHRCAARHHLRRFSIEHSDRNHPHPVCPQHAAHQGGGTEDLGGHRAAGRAGRRTLTASSTRVRCRPR